MPIRLIISIVLLSVHSYLSALTLSHIDSLSIQTPYESERSIDALVSYCEKSTWNDFQRVRFYFVWIATHVQYDEGIYNPQTPEYVFTNKKALCSGYARLLAHFCEKSHIPARYVAGYGREPEDASTIQNHAWNVIQVSNKWYLFDVTWAANSLDDDKDNPLTPAFEEWFISPPETFQLKGYQCGSK